MMSRRCTDMSSYIIFYKAAAANGRKALLATKGRVQACRAGRAVLKRQPGHRAGIVYSNKLRILITRKQGVATYHTLYRLAIIKE